MLSRRTFAIISHPDAGKTTLTEQLLLYGGVIQEAGTVKARKAARHATSDWMELEKQRGISVTSSVMQFPYRDHIINLLDTPGHGDFSEDTYRTLTAVDSALMVMDSGKGVEDRTIKLLEVCRLRDTPIYTFINKLDRDGLEPIDLLDEIEQVLQIQCAPVTWPIGMGRTFQGIYHLDEQIIYPNPARFEEGAPTPEPFPASDDAALNKLTDGGAEALHEEIELVQGASHQFDHEAYTRGELTPVFFGTALGNFGIRQLLDSFVENAPQPQPRATRERLVQPEESAFTGFVFKVQANMDPAHHDRIAFLRVCSGSFEQGMKLRHVRLKRVKRINDAIQFFAGERGKVEIARAGDIIGLHNHGNIHIGDTFTLGEELHFSGIPDFAPELFRRAQLRDPLRSKALNKGLDQLCEEGATQVFRPINRNDVVLGAVGPLQFEVVAYRLKNEYRVECGFESVAVYTARWVYCEDETMLRRFRTRNEEHLALDHKDQLVYLAPTRVNLDLARERWPEVEFKATREHSA